MDGDTGQFPEKLFFVSQFYPDLVKSDDDPDSQYAVTDLDWDWNDDASPDGILAISLMHPSRGSKLLAYKIDTVDGQYRYRGFSFYDNLRQAMPNALSTAVSHRPDGSRVVAFGMEDGSVMVMDPAVSSSSLVAQVGGSASAPVDALTFTDRVDGTVGVPDLVAVSSRGNSARVLRYDGTSALQPLPLAAGGGATTSATGIRAWFPGYKTGLVDFNNETDSAIRLDFAARPNASYGCWYSQELVERPPALPSTPVVLDHGRSSGFTIGFRTAGEGGGCASSDFTGQWAVYVTITPLDRPADRTVAKLAWSRDGQLSVQSIGGSLELDYSQVRDNRPLGAWGINIQSPPSPGVPASLKVTGTRLDPAGTDQPVYRFDVPATTWPLPVASPPRIQTVLPPLEVHGITASGDDVSLGLLVPQGQPTRATSGSVTLSPVSFYWQNPSDGEQITDVYVQAGSTSSSRVNLAGLPSPAASTEVKQLVVCPATGSTSCDGTADPFATGLDEAKLLIQPKDGNNQVLPLTDPAYQRIYYRDEDGDLLTGLIPEDGSSYTRVSPYAGAYPNDGSTSSSVRPPINGSVGGRYGYVSTTTTDEQEITAQVGGSTEASAAIVVQAQDFEPFVQPGAQAAQGFYVTGCADSRGSNACRLANITTTGPGLFLSTDPDTGELRIGLQFTTTAQTSLASLPLQQVAGQPEHTVAANPLIVSNGEVHLNTTSGFQPADTIDTWLVSHGTQVEIDNIRVGGAN